MRAHLYSVECFRKIDDRCISSVAWYGSIPDICLTLYTRAYNVYIYVYGYIELHVRIIFISADEKGEVESYILCAGVNVMRWVVKIN